MWNPFRKKRKTEYVSGFDFDFKTFNNFYQYLINEESHITVLVEGLKDEAEILWYEFPYSYESSDVDVEILKNLGFDNFYDILNIVHEKANIGLVDVEQDIETKRQYDLLVFNFYIDSEEDNQFLKNNIKCTFYLLFVCENDAEEINAFRVFYTKGLDYSIKDFLNAKYIANINNPEEEDRIIIEDFEKVLAAFSQDKNIEINENILAKFPNARISKEVFLQDFIDLLKVANYIKIDNLENKAQMLFQKWQNNKDGIFSVENEEEYYDDGYFPFRFDIISEENYWYSDWKFDPEDAEYFIASLLNEKKWTFNYPKDTYSDDLFPYIQKALDEKGLQLLNLDTLGDSYGFFIVKKEDATWLLSISDKLKLGICLL